MEELFERRYNLSDKTICELEREGLKEKGRICAFCDADGAKIKIKLVPLQILGLHWDILIFDKHMKIGCEFHLIKEWDNFNDGQINIMNSHALEFWKKSKDFIMFFCKENGRG